VNDNKTRPLDAGSPDEIIQLLSGLRLSADGLKLHAQIERGSREHGAIRDAVDCAFVDFVHTLLQKYVKDAKSDPATRVRAIIAQQRLAAHLGVRNEARAAEAPGVDAAGFEQHVASVLWSKREPPGFMRRAADHPLSGIGPANGSAHPPAALRGIDLERTRDEIEALQANLAAKIGQAHDQNLDFVAHLKTVQLALREAQALADLDALRRILVEGTEELIQGHQGLDRKLRAATDFLEAMKARHAAIHVEIGKVRAVALTDEFTGMPNRAAFLRRLEAEAGRAQRYGCPLSLAIIDPDRFDNIRDYVGRDAGDAVIRAYADQILAHFRSYDVVARYGEDEFAVLLPDTGREQALSALRKVQAQVNGIHYQHGGRCLSVPTFSTGLTWYKPGESTASLIERAGYALHRARVAGPNRIEALAPAL